MDGHTPDKLLDIDKVIASVKPAWKDRLPRWLVRKIGRLVHVDELNAIWARHRDKDTQEFLSAINKDFNVTLVMQKEERMAEAVASSNPIFIANHPLGGPESILLMEKIGWHAGFMKMITRKYLLAITPLLPYFLPIPAANKREEVAAFLQGIKDPGPILVFPAGFCSRYLSNGVLFDYEWKSTFIKLARTYHRPLVPLYIEARNSRRFYRLSKLRQMLGIKSSPESILLVDEMFRQNGSTITCTVGKPIDWHLLTPDVNDTEWAKRLRQHVYNLSLDADTEFSADIPLTLPEM